MKPFGQSIASDIIGSGPDADDPADDAGQRREHHSELLPLDTPVPNDLDEVKELMEVKIRKSLVNVEQDELHA